MLEWRNTVRLLYIPAILVIVAGILAGCGGDAAPAVDSVSPTQETSEQTVEESAGSEGDASTAPDASYEGALPVSSQLAVGIMQLEGTENAVTPEQAKMLLPLWQALQGDTLQSDAEADAALKQIEGAMTAEQLAAIAALQITFEDMGVWLQAQGLNFGRPEGTEGQGQFRDLSEEERAAMRATRQASGGAGSGQGGSAAPGGVSEEERASKRATAEASGTTLGGRGGGAGQGQIALLAEQVVDLLTQRAAE